MRTLTLLALALLSSLLAGGCATPPPPPGAPSRVESALPGTGAAARGAPVIPAQGGTQAGTAVTSPATAAVPAPPPPVDPVDAAYALMERVHQSLSRPGEAESTLTLARDLAGRLPTHPDSWILLGWAARRAGSPAAANGAFKKALELDRNRADALFAMAEMAAETGSQGGAHDLLVRAWNDFPGIESARRLAAADLLGGRPDEARAVLTATREALPEDQSIIADLSAALDAAGNAAHALSILPFREGMPTPQLLARVSLQLRQGQLEGASADLERALSRGDAGANGALLLGILKVQRGDLAGAEEQFRRVTRDHPELAEGHLELGLSLRRQGRFAESRAAYEAGLGVRQLPELHLNLGVLCELYLGDKAAARAHYQRYVDLGGAGADRVRGWIDYLSPGEGAPAGGQEGKP